MNIKGQDLYEELRALKGWGLGVILSPRGPGHLRGAPLTENSELSPEESEKFYGVPTANDRKTYEGKPKLVKYFEDFKAVVDCMNICYILTQWSSPHLMGPEDLSELYSSATGKSLTGKK